MGRCEWARAFGAVVLVGVGTCFAVGTVQQIATNQGFQSVRESIVSPDGWTFTQENLREVGIFGTCFTSAYDVRVCPSSTDSYSVARNYSEGALAAALRSSGVTVSETDCVPLTWEYASCSVVGQKGGYTVELLVLGEVGLDGDTSDLRGRVSVRP